MGKRRIWPMAFRSIGAMIDQDVITKARCIKCQNFFDVDLQPLEAKWGRGFSLINQSLTCKVTSCRGTGYFAGAGHIDAPLITLLDADADPLKLGGLTPRDIEPPTPPDAHEAQLISTT